MKNGPVIVVEDDIDDQEFILDALKVAGLQNEVKIFENGLKALNYLVKDETVPFMIISDVNLPVMNGLQLKAEIQKSMSLRVRSIPFIFLTTTADSRAVAQAFELSVQGFFVKENTYDGIIRQLKYIIEYWKSSKHPNANDN